MRGDEAAALAEDPSLPGSLGAADHGCLARAAFVGRFQAAELMLRLGFDPRSPGVDGGSALHAACWVGHVPLVERLLALDGAPIDTPDPTHGSPPLGWAAFGSVHRRASGGDYVTVIDRLVAAGADVRATGNKAGRSFVEMAAGNARRVLVSLGGGAQPRWSRDGRELFYVGPQGMMVVSVGAGPEFTPGRPELSFETTSYHGNDAGVPFFDVTQDGQRFLMLVPAEGLRTRRSSTWISRTITEQESDYGHAQPRSSRRLREDRDRRGTRALRHCRSKGAGRVPARAVEPLERERRPVRGMALRIEKAFGVSMDTLMRMQAACDIARARKTASRIRVRRYDPDSALA